MTTASLVAAVVVAALLPVVSFVQLLYTQALRLRAREQDALLLFKEQLEPRIGLKLDEGALVFSIFKHGLLCLLAILVFASFEHPSPTLPLPELLPRLSIAGIMAEAILLSFVLMLLLAHVFPQVLYRRTSAAWLVPAAGILRLTALLSTPLLMLLRLMKTLADLSSNEPKEEERDESDQIEALITAGKEEGLIEEDDRKLIQSVVEFGDKTVREVMTPRIDLVGVAEEASLEELRAIALRERYSRIPTYSGGIDNVTGFVHVRDMYELDPAERARKKVRDIRRKIELVPETKPVDDLLRLMQEKGEHIVAVIDEYGNTAGIATMEDLVEEIVGEIRDEHEPERDVREEPGGSVVVSGNFDLDRLAELFGLRPSDETESTTIGGLAQEWLGHVPAAGECVERDGLRIEVLNASDRRVSEVRLSRVEKAASNGERNGKEQEKT